MHDEVVHVPKVTQQNRAQDSHVDHHVGGAQSLAPSGKGFSSATVPHEMHRGRKHHVQADHHVDAHVPQPQEEVVQAPKSGAARSAASSRVYCHTAERWIASEAAEYEWYMARAKRHDAIAAAKRLG